MSPAATLTTGLAIVTLVTIALLVPLLLLGALNAALTWRRVRRDRVRHAGQCDGQGSAYNPRLQRNWRDAA